MAISMYLYQSSGEDKKIFFTLAVIMRASGMLRTLLHKTLDIVMSAVLTDGCRGYLSRLPPAVILN